MVILMYVIITRSIFTVLLFDCYISRKDEWERSYLCPSCQSRDLLSYPDFSILMLKYFMQLAVGITSGEFQKKNRKTTALKKNL
jgi:hypothetical protein